MANLTDLMVRSLDPTSNSETKVFNSSGNKANAVATAVIAAVAGKTSILDGFEITASGATAGTVANVTVTDGTWTLNYTFTFPTGAATGATPLIVNLPRPLVASAQNTAITITLPASGVGGTNAVVNARGRQI